jgi:hypothetical protein
MATGRFPRDDARREWLMEVSESGEQLWRVAEKSLKGRISADVALQVAAARPPAKRKFSNASTNRPRMVISPAQSLDPLTRARSSSICSSR